jgi:hypothetical protein
MADENLTLKDLALQTLRSVCSDQEAPAAAKAGAARTILELIGEIGRNATATGDTSSKSLSELTSAELDEEIKRLSKKK